MSDKTKIEWSDATWTPVRARRKDTGKIGVHCERISPGCTHCYSCTFNKRKLPNQGTGLDFTVPNREKVDIFLDEKILAAPLRWKKPRKIFVCSQTDLFAEFVPFEFIDRVFAVMALCPHHVFQVLTKRANRMREYLISRTAPSKDLNSIGFYMNQFNPEIFGERMAIEIVWPLPSVWLGVSVENQRYADERIPLLLQTPAAKRFISYEPALGPVDLTAIVHRIGPASFETFDCLYTKDSLNRGQARNRIDWVIVGGESGPRARPFNINWARSVVRQCQASSIPVFVKQIGAHPYACRESDHGKPDHQSCIDEVSEDIHDRKGGDMSEWPEDLRIREFPK